MVKEPHHLIDPPKDPYHVTRNEAASNAQMIKAELTSKSKRITVMASLAI